MKALHTVSMVCAMLWLTGVNRPQDADKRDTPSPVVTNPLVGDWEATTDHGKERMSYELIAGGSSLIERDMADNRPTMLTVYNVDGSRLILTHFCMAGNQPRMQARSYDPATGELDFRFMDATNLASPNAGHMHNAKFRFVDNDHLSVEWQYFENGKPKFTEAQQYTRVTSK